MKLKIGKLDVEIIQAQWTKIEVWVWKDEGYTLIRREKMYREYLLAFLEEMEKFDASFTNVG